MKPKMHLAFDLSWTHLQGRWRLPGSWTGAIYPDLTIFKEIASIAERGLIDMLFFGDGTGIPATWRGSPEEAVRWGIGWPRQDMSGYIAALGQLTKHVGFGITYSSTFMHPFYVSRLLNSLDHLTNGRIAFNVVASTRRADAANYGFDELMEHDLRYERMEEFVHVCKALWASVAPDAFVWNRETGVVVADTKKVQPINHAGAFFKVKGPLSCVPSPQGRPVLIQAGGSPRGIKASANFADHVFGAGKPIKLKAKHRQELDAELVAQGRDPSQVGILWDVIVVVEETEAEAKRRREALLTAIPFEAAGAFISHGAGYDFSKLPARFTPKEINEQIIASNASPVGFVHRLGIDIGETTEITREEFFEYGLRSATGYDHTIAGTAAQVADHFEEEFETTGSRGGFMIAHPQSTPRDLLNVVDFLVPELQRRGRFRTAYEGATLTENLAA
ncbi:MAG TPA: NtaA/DmoA family FMN-dependent monooxygenase [Stellaceae bacterium]|jgi:FMN-dependent oxidoreductase (nitrilotriacetate monooxygenase family)|nr:NtaA/DmoA family FMN-dependent monooxygenase [Stellaceae bacterium]